MELLSFKRVASKMQLGKVVPPPRISSVILAGGDSRRMGNDKAFLRWGRVTLIEHIIDVLCSVSEDLVIAVKDARPFRRLKARVVEDIVPGSHSLGGLYTGLAAVHNECCFVCACDTPFIKGELIRYLALQLNGFDAVIPRSARGFEMLHAVYAKSALKVLEEQLQLHQWELTNLVSRIQCRTISETALRHLDPEGLSFFNVNTPSDYERACRIQRRLTLHRRG